jgi:phage-related protein
MIRQKSDEPRPLIWRGTSKGDFAAFPPSVQREMGYALFLAQMGERHTTRAKTLKGLGGGTVVEVRESYDGNAYRVVYTVRYADAVLCPSRVPEEIKDGYQDAKTRLELDREAITGPD